MLLESAGWTVLRFWEHEDPEESAAAVLSLISHDNHSPVVRSIKDDNFRAPLKSEP